MDIEITFCHRRIVDGPCGEARIEWAANVVGPTGHESVTVRTSYKGTWELAVQKIRPLYGRKVAS